MTDMQSVNSSILTNHSYDVEQDFNNALQDTRDEISQTLSAAKDGVDNAKENYDAGWDIKRDNLFNIFTPSALYVERNQEASQINQTSSKIVFDKAIKNNMTINSFSSSTSKQEVEEIIGKLLSDSNEMIAAARKNVRSSNANLSAAEQLVEKLDDSWIFPTSDVERDNVEATKASVADAKLILKEAKEDFASIMELIKTHK